LRVQPPANPSHGTEHAPIILEPETYAPVATPPRPAGGRRPYAGRKRFAVGLLKVGTATIIVRDWARFGLVWMRRLWILICRKM
jgi:hypothetical protein